MTKVNLKGEIVTDCGDLGAGGGSVPPGVGADATSPFLLASSMPSLTHSRVLSIVSGQLTLVDGGAGSTLTLGLAASGVSAGTYSYPILQVDTFGRIVSIASGAPGVTTARSVIAGDGLIGGGTLAADRTFAVGASDSTIIVDADGIRVDPTALPFPTAGTGILSGDDHNADGTSPHFARVDHVHNAGVLSFAIAAGSAGNASVGGSASDPQLDVWPLNLIGLADSDVTVGTTGSVYNFTSFTTNHVATLPALSGVTGKTQFLFKDSSTDTGHTLTITPQSGETIDGVAGSISFSTGVGESRMLMKTSGGWVVVSSNKAVAAPVTYTFTSGLTNTSGTVTNDLVTGVSGGQTATGGTASGDFLKLQSTTNSTKGPIQIGATALATFTENLTKASGASATLDLISFPSNTVTITGTTNVTNANGFNYLSVAAPVYTDSSAVAVTHAATMAIKGPPTVSGSATITNPYPLWVQAGNVRMDGTLTVGSAPQSGFIFTVQPSAFGLTKAQVHGLGNSSGQDTQFFVTNSGGQANVMVFANNHFTTGTLAGITKVDMCGITNAAADAGTFVVGTLGTQDFALIANSTEVARLTNANKNLLIGTTTDVASTKVRVDATKTIASAAGAVWDGVDHIAATLTLTGSTNVTTATGVNANVFRAPTLTYGSGTQTVTNAATVAISGAPIAGGSGPMVITNSMALWVQGGVGRFDGNVGIGGMPSVPLHVVKSASGSEVIARVENTSNTSSSGAVVEAAVNGSSSGNPVMRLTAPGTISWDTYVDVAAGGFYRIKSAGTVRLTIGNSSMGYQGTGDGVLSLGQSLTTSLAGVTLTGTASGATANFNAYGSAHAATVFGIAAANSTALISNKALLIGSSGAFDTVFAANNVETGRFTSAGNLSVFQATTYGSGVGVVAIKNATTAPTAATTAGVALYSDGGRLKYIDPTGIITVL